MHKHPDLFDSRVRRDKMISFDNKQAHDIHLHCRKYLPEINMMRETGGQDACNTYRWTVQ